MATFWTVMVPAGDVPRSGDPVEIIRSETGRGYDAWSRGLKMPIEQVADFGERRGRQLIEPRELRGTIRSISIVDESLAVMGIEPGT